MAASLIALGSVNTVQAAPALEEVIVTAQKRSQDLQDVPVAVAVLSGDELANRHVNQIQSLVHISPSLTFSQGFSDGSANIRIRGLGTNVLSRGLEQSVSTVVDGVVATGVTTSLLDFSDVQRIEILRGPQGMLFGKNASAGVLNIVTSVPTEEFAARLGASYADENEVKVNGFINGGLGIDGLAGRLAFYSNKRDPFLDNIAGPKLNDRDEWGVRIRLAYDLTDNLSALFTYNRAERDHVCCSRVAEELIPGGTADRNGVPAGPENTTAASFDIIAGDTTLDVYALELNYGRNEFMLTSVTSYTDSVDHIEGNGLFNLPFRAVADFYDENKIEQFTQEIRLASPQGQAIDYLLGLYYTDWKLDRQQVQALDAFTVGAVPAQNFFYLGHSVPSMVETTSAAVFGHATWNATDRARLSLGLRWQYDTIDLDLTVEGVADRYPDVPIVRPLNPPGSIRADDNDSALSWRVTGEYDLTEEAMIYATVARGYKGMGANTEAAVLGSPLPLVEGEIPTTYEIGIKSRWWDNRFQLNADAFYTEVEDFQTNQRFETEETTVGAHFLANAESLETQGVELELSLAATENLYLSAAIAYVDATYKTYTGASCYFAQPASSCIDGSQDLSGEPLPNSPDWSYSLSARYQKQLGSLPLDGFAQANYYWRDDLDDTDPRNVRPDYAIADLTLGIAARDGRWRVQVFAKNLFDEFWITSRGGATPNTNGILISHGLAYEYKRRIGVSAEILF